MANYIVPTMPLTMNVWRAAGVPPAPPDVVCPCNLSPGARVFFGAQGARSPTDVYMAMEALVPKGTDLRGWQAATPDGAEVPAGSGRLYIVFWVDDVAKGFANEHRLALLAQRASWPFPTP